MRFVVALAATALLAGAAAGCHDDCAGPKTLPCPVGANVACVNGTWACVPGDSGIVLPPPRDLATAPAHD